MQYQSECRTVLKSVVNISKPFEKTFMDTMKLFMAIPNRINFLQLGKYGRFSEQTYRNLFKNETFDWFAFNDSIIGEHLTDQRKTIAIDPSYIPKSGHKTPWIGYFWSGCARDYKHGLEIMDIGVIDIDNHECMTLGAIQTPDSKTLDSVDKTLEDWFSYYLISRKDQLQKISNRVVADAFFSKETFIALMSKNSFHVKSFLIAKSKIEVCPMFHFTPRRIEAHVCICFVALKVYKEFERILKMTNIKMSVDKVLNIVKSITTIRVYVPKNKKYVTKTMIMKRHQRIEQLFDENFWVAH